MASETDSYCAETDVVARAQYLSDFTTTTVPTQAQLLDFQAQRAAELYTILRDVLGTGAPGPASYGTTIDTSTDAGTALQFVLISFNAIGAAFDALQAAGAGEEPSRTERAAELWAMWETRDAEIRKAALMYQGYATRSATHESVGEITPATVVSREEDGLVFKGNTEW